MTTLFPTALDTIVSPTASTPTNQSVVPHAAQHIAANTAIMALQAKLGIDLSNDETSVDFKLRGKVNFVEPPTTLTQAGAVGSIALDSTHLYVCTAVNTWSKIVLGDPVPVTSLYQIGDVFTTANVLAAPTWLPCDGTAYLQADYPDLFSKLGLIPTQGLETFTYDTVTQFATPTVAVYGVTAYIRAT